MVPHSSLQCLSVRGGGEGGGGRENPGPAPAALICGHFTMVNTLAGIQNLMSGAMVKSRHDPHINTQHNLPNIYFSTFSPHCLSVFVFLLFLLTFLFPM